MSGLQPVLLRGVLIAFVSFVVSALTGMAIFAVPEYGPIPLLMLLFFAAMIAKSPRRSPATLGSAQLAELEDVFHAGLTDCEDGILLGEATGLEPPGLLAGLQSLFFLPPWQSRRALQLFLASPKKSYRLRLPDHLSPHIAFVSPTGGGKSAAYAITNLLMDHSCAIVLDYKGELMRNTAHVRRDRFGQIVGAIAPFGVPDDIDIPVFRFNPLQLIDPQSPFVLDDCRSIADSLIIKSKNEQQPFFPDSAKLFVQNVLGGIVYGFPDAESSTLNQMKTIVTIASELDAFVDYLQTDVENERDLVCELAGQLNSFQGDTRYNVLATVNSQLEWMQSPSIAASLSDTTFQPGELLRNRPGMTLYVHLPVDRIRTYRGYTRVILTALINFIIRAGESRTRRIRFYLDESSGLGPDLESLYTSLVYGRSYGIRLNFFYQAISQVQEMFPESRADDFIANTIQVYTGTRDVKTAKQISEWIGRRTVETESRQRGHTRGFSVQQQQRQGGSVGHSWSWSSSCSTHQMARELIQPEEILQLPKSTSLVLLPYCRPIIARPVFYFQDKILNRLACTRR
ncbi:MAG: type IV secretory system conjugative DNA transfer family protein [Planctomycetales bacterium]|nr:type IV secretory system conjugative DNA transfer family protein [Planctomycetales bacterium]